MKILIIDDEADRASISNTAVEYKQAQKERKGINKLIVHLVEDTHYKDAQTNGHVRAMNYVMYTATPYANFLNESTEESLYPRNFIWTLKPPMNTLGQIKSLALMILQSPMALTSRGLLLMRIWIVSPNCMMAKWLTSLKA